VLRLIYKYELKKIICAPAIIGFLVLSVFLNVIIVFAGYANTPDIDAQIDITVMPDIFDNYDSSIIAERYIARHNIYGKYAENVRNKYKTLQTVIDEKGKNNDSISYYFGEQTRSRHSLLFKTLFGAIAAESCLAALFVSLLSVGYENMRNTEAVIYTSKRGRMILRTKYLASLTAAFLSFVFIIGVTLSIYFLRFDYSEVWNCNVSSLFNSSVSEGSKPLITWGSFTVLQFVWSYAAISAGLVVCFVLIGFSIGVFMRSSYGAVVVCAGLLATMYVTVPLFPYGGMVRSILNSSPVMLWLNIGDWFTDGYADILWRNFECRGIVYSLLISIIASMVAFFHFHSRDA
jgi:hypothetical protein